MQQHLNEENKTAYKFQPMIANSLTILGFIGTVYTLYYFTHRLDSVTIISVFFLLMAVFVTCFVKGVSMVR